MNDTSRLVKRFVGAAVALMLIQMAGAAEEALVTAVFSRVHNGYERKKAADGSMPRETYVVAKGTYDRGLAGNPSIDRVPFAGMVRALAPYLARQNYAPAADRESADLMLVLHWGTTKPLQDGLYDSFRDSAARSIADVTSISGTNGRLPNTPALGELNRVEIEEMGAVRAAAQQEMVSALLELEMANRLRDEANTHNANLLGYIHEINRRNDLTRHAGAGTSFDELIQEIEEERYYVVIGAYDFQAVLKGKPRLVWSTRVSIRAQGNRFDAWLPTMFANASEHFGDGSGRLVRRFQRATRVELGELKTLGIVGDGEAETQRN